MAPLSSRIQIATPYLRATGPRKCLLFKHTCVIASRVIKRPGWGEDGYILLSLNSYGPKKAVAQPTVSPNSCTDPPLCSLDAAASSLTFYCSSPCSAGAASASSSPSLTVYSPSRCSGLCSHSPALSVPVLCSRPPPHKGLFCSALRCPALGLYEFQLCP